MKYVSREFCFRLLVGILGALILNSCTRPAGNTAQLTLNLPIRQMDAAGAYPVHAAVNISASDIPTTLYRSWDQSDKNSSNSSITLNFDKVPQGSNRLVQVLYVSQDAQNNLYFYYTDSTTDITGDVTIPMTPAALTTSSVQGKIVGRYLNSSGAGPTGILKSYFVPGPGKPAMIVDQNEIFGGWFSAFSLPGQNFNYQFEDGTVLLPNFQASATNVNGQTTALLKIPASYRNNGNETDSNSPEIILAGFFGPGSSGKKICVNTAASTSIPSLFADAATSVAMTWNGSGSACGTNQACLISGGDGIATDCTSIDYVSKMQLDEQLLASSDEAFLFRGPFKITDSGSGNSQSLTGSLSGNTLNLSWQFMPGAAAGLDGVEIFYKLVDDNSSDGQQPYQINNGYDCANLTNQTNGFTSGGQYSIANPTAAITVPTPTTSQSLTAIACPFSRSRTPIYLNGGVQWWGGNTAMTSNNQLKVVVVGTSPNTTQSGTCTPLSIKLLDLNGNLLNASVATSVNLSAVASNLSGSHFSNANDCSDNLLNNTSVTIAAGTSSTAIYFIPGVIGNFSINAAAINTYPTFLNLGAIVGAGTAQRLYITSNTNMAFGQCYPVNYDLAQSSPSMPATSNSAITFSLLVNAGDVTGRFYNDPTCAGTPLAAAVSIPAGTHEVTYYFKPATGSSGTLDVSTPSPTLSSGKFPLSINVASATQGTLAQAFSISTNLSNNLYDGEHNQCFQVFISATNSIGAAIQPTSDEVVSLGGISNLSYFSDADCEIPSSSSTYTVKASGQTTPLFAQATAASVSGALSSAYGSSNTLGLYVAPPVQYQLIASGNYGEGLCYPLNIQAFDTNGPYIVPNYPTTFGVYPTGMKFFVTSNCAVGSEITGVTFNSGSSQSDTMYAMFTDTAPSVNLGGTPYTSSYPLSYSGANIYPTEISLNTAFINCSTTGTDVGYMLKVNGVPVSSATLQPGYTLNSEALDLSTGQYPKICPNTLTAYSSCPPSGSMSTIPIAPGVLSGTFNFKFAATATSGMVQLNVASPTGIAILSNVITCVP